MVGEGLGGKDWDIQEGLGHPWWGKKDWDIQKDWDIHDLRWKDWDIHGHRRNCGIQEEGAGHPGSQTESARIWGIHLVCRRWRSRDLQSPGRLRSR